MTELENLSHNNIAWKCQQLKTKVHFTTTRTICFHARLNNRLGWGLIIQWSIKAIYQTLNISETWMLVVISRKVMIKLTKFKCSAKCYTVTLLRQNKPLNGWLFLTCNKRYYNLHPVPFICKSVWRQLSMNTINWFDQKNCYCK